MAYYVADGSVIVKHVDGRGFGGLQTLFDNAIFDSKPVKTYLIGGICTPNFRGEYIHDYNLLEQKYTRANFDKLIKFWVSNDYRIDLKGWAIGHDIAEQGVLRQLPENRARIALCSDFLAGAAERIHQLRPGVALDAGLIPELEHRSAAYMEQNFKYIPVYDSSRGQHLSIPSVSPDERDRHFYRRVLAATTDAELLSFSSTTPDLEPPHFCKAMRNIGNFVLNTTSKPAVTIPWTKNHVIVLQGEAGRLNLAQAPAAAKPAAEALLTPNNP